MVEMRTTNASKSAIKRNNNEALNVKFKIESIQQLKITNNFLIKTSYRTIINSKKTVPKATNKIFEEHFVYQRGYPSIMKNANFSNMLKSI